jgi:uncharacterized repeat protein (TIGR01451 family)
MPRSRTRQLPPSAPTPLAVRGRVSSLRPRWLPKVALGLFLGAIAVPAWTQSTAEIQSVAEATGSGPLETSIEVQLLDVSEGPGGQETRRWVAADRLNAGDEIHYTVRVRNSGAEFVTDIIVTKRLPFGVRYLRNSAAGPAAEVQFSIDGGKTFATPDALARAAGGGKKSARKALEGEYTHVRWVLAKPLGPASTALLRFRATFS